MNWTDFITIAIILWLAISLPRLEHHGKLHSRHKMRTRRHLKILQREEKMTESNKTEETEKKQGWEKREETPSKKPEFKQPFYCHWKGGKWDGKFRDVFGNIVE